jgi:starch synthase (maltosyl-transferring)
MPELAPNFELPRVVIDQITPMLDGGRYPVKRTIGSVIEIGAAIFKDGHDLIGARVIHRLAGDPGWQSIPLVYAFEVDRWFGSFRADRLGRVEYAVQGWPDHFGTWRSELEKRLNAGQDVRPELAEGAAIVARYEQAAGGDATGLIARSRRDLADAKLGLDERLKVALSTELKALLSGPMVPNEIAQGPLLELIVDRVEATFSAWYELFPRSQSQVPGQHGTFADTLSKVPEIAAQGFDVLYLPPIHPIGEVNRKGRNNARVAEPGDVGSPWAIGSRHGGHTAVEPALGTIDDFVALVNGARDFGLEIALDYALQCAPDHPWVREHPDWFFIRTDGTIRYAENPPKKYEDIYPINFWCEDRKRLWEACRNVLLFWIERGVKIFRVDNPHTKPLAFWEWVLRDIHEKHPDVFFLSESFTRPNRLKSLAKLGFNQSYTYFTWKNSAWELKDYLTELTQPETQSYFRPNFFANTPDILHEYLQSGGRPAFRIRLVLAATLSPSYGIYSGFELCENVPVRHGSEEYMDSEKYEIRSRDLNAHGNIKQDVARINRIRRENAALHELGNLEFLHSEYEGVLAFRKFAPNNEIIVVVNLDPFHVHETMIHVPLQRLGIADGEPYEMADLMSGARYTWRGARNFVRLDPTERVAHVFRVSRRLD